MLFYGKTKIFLTSASIKQIAGFWSPEGLLELLDSGVATFCYQQNMVAIHTHNTGSGRERYKPVLVEIAQSPGVDAGPELLVRRVLEELIGKRGRARRLTTQVCRRLIVHRSDRELPSRVTADLLDTDLVSRGVRRVIGLYAPDLILGPDTRFEVQQVDDGLRVLTNINFEKVNASYHARVPASQSSVTPALLLAHFLTAREMVEEAAASKVDIAADPIHSALASLRIEAALSARSANEANVARFQDFLFDEGRAVRDAVNERRASLKDILALIEKAKKLKVGWLANQ
jgi:hypothetical protein